MRRCAARLTIALAVTGALLPSATPRAEPSRNIADYVILAGEELIAKRLVVEAGDVGVNSGFLQSKQGVEGPSSRFVADQVRIGEKSRCLELSGNDVVQTGAACELVAGFEGPLFPSLGEACAFPTSPTPCDPSRPVVVPHKETEVLPPGAYGDVSVAGGPPGRASLVLQGGDYSFCSLRLGVRARLHVQAPSTVYVAGRVTLWLGTVTGPAPGTGLGAGDLQLFAGDRARLGRRAQLTGLICAPNALLHLNDGARLVGRGVGKFVHVGRVTVRGVTGGSPTTTIASPTSTSTSSTATSTSSTTASTSSPTTTSIGTSTTSTTSTTVSTSTTTSIGSSTTPTTSTTSTSAVLPSTTSTSVPGPSTTSTSSPVPTTTTSTSSSTSSTGAVPTTSSTTSSVTTTSSTSTTTLPTAVCGNETVESPETCDDGNTTDCGTAGQCISGADFCPANCIVAACGNPQTGGPRRDLDISVNATLGSGQKLGTVRVYLDYPDGVVVIPGSADDSQVLGSLSMTPPGANCIPNDLEYGLIQACLSFNGYAPGQFTRVGFVDCDGGPPSIGQFQCRVLDATDQIGATVSATCSVSLVP